MLLMHMTMKLDCVLTPLSISFIGLLMGLFQHIPISIYMQNKMHRPPVTFQSTYDINHAEWIRVRQMPWKHLDLEEKQCTSCSDYIRYQCNPWCWLQCAWQYLASGETCKPGPSHWTHTPVDADLHTPCLKEQLKVVLTQALAFETSHNHSNGWQW